MAGSTTRRTAALTALWRALRAGRTGEAGLGEHLRSVPRMVRASLSGRYDGLSRSRLGALLLGVLYVVSPVDLVPEAALALLGLGDDALVVAWLAGAVLSSTDDFLRWEKAGGAGTHDDPRVVPGHVVR